ncbi:hypothetical protein FH972_023431 [Carpinus fangiana]|uniref:Methyltransferase domain-containing protein n=1 Tax=Carpinus fangiana TaxID=176857 RepID=A0A5N6KV65_9ROSI|nr:hypothetical protein FH972_023431 [Carpinus fangiana]
MTQQDFTSYIAVILKINDDTHIFDAIEYDPKISGSNSQNVSSIAQLDTQAKLDMKEAAIKRLGTVAPTTESGWALAHFEYSKSDCRVHVRDFEINSVADVKIQHSSFEMAVIQNTFPGGLDALKDTLLMVKRIHDAKSQGQQTYPEIGGARTFYDKYTTYDQNVLASKQYDMMQGFAETYLYEGTVLDLACGTGLWGRALDEAQQSPLITGARCCNIVALKIVFLTKFVLTTALQLDISTEMIKGPSIVQTYLQPIVISTIQEFIILNWSYDHITCWGALHFLDSIDFNAVMSRMFSIAKKSISFELDEVCEKYRDGFVQRFNCPCYNNSELLDQFRIPAGWAKVKDDRLLLYKSPSIGVDVFARAVYFEKS